MKNTRRLKNAFLVVFLFSVFPVFNILAEEDLLLSNYDANFILNRLPKVMTDQWIDSIVQVKSGKEQAAIVILKQASQQRTFNYLLKQAPKEVVKEVARVGWQIYNIGSGSELHEIIGSFEKETANEAVNYLLKIIKEQKLKISFGDFEVEYQTINEDFSKNTFQYIIVYKPVTETQGLVTIRIYSPDNLTPPKSKGDPWSGAINYTWFSDTEIEKSKIIPPFIAQISGSMERKKSGYWQKEIIHEYSFSGSPGLTITFPETVPKFEFPEEGWLGNILSSAKDKLQTIAELLGASLVKEEELRPKEESDTPTISFEEELAQKIAELEDKYDEAKADSKTTISELNKLKDDMATLLKQFVNFTKPEDEEEKKAEEEEEQDEIETNDSPGEIEERVESQQFKLVISEVCSGMDNSKSEFIEIFNPNDFSVKIDDENFSLWIVDSKDKPTQKRITWIRNNIPAKGYFLFAGSELFFSGLKFDADAYYSNQITSAGGTIISQKSGEDFDKAGWGKISNPAPETSIEGEGKTLENGLESNISLVRKMFGQGHIDTNNNESDFEISHFPSPRNSLNQESVYYPKSQYSFPSSPSPTFSNPSDTTQANYSKVLISEMKNKGENSSDDFIELFNPNNQDINLHGWQLKKKTSSGSESSIIVFSDNHILKSQQYFVWASAKDEYNQIIQSDASSSAYLADNNSVALFNPNKNIVDAFAWQESIAPFVEGNYFDSSHEKDQSIGRKVTNSSYIDNENNATDFEIQIPTPGSINQKYQITPSGNEIPDEEENNTEMQCSASGIVISEVKLAKTEYVELFNPSSQSISLSKCYLSYFSSLSDWNDPTRNWIFPDSLIIGGRQHILIGIYADALNTLSFDWQAQGSSGNNYSSQQLAQNGAIGIFSCNPSSQSDSLSAKNCKIDAVGWDTSLVKEENNAEPSPEEKSMARIIDPDEIGQVAYKDTNDNNQDFEIQDPSPREFSYHEFSDLDNDGLLDVKDINVTIGFNTFLDPGEYIFKNLTITNNSTITLKGNCNDDLGVKLIVKNLTIEDGSLLSANSQGCPGDSGYGAGYFGSGGGYGGRGAGDNSIEGQDSYYGDGGLTYGDMILPSNLGSGGGGLGGLTGGSGGGAIIVEAEETITINGSISADGQSINGKTGGGSGGSIYLVANEISGDGIITANGGGTTGSGGGGGRIAIYYNSLGVSDIQAYGGNQLSSQFDGAAGTIFLKNKSQNRGELIVKNNNLDGLAQTVIENSLTLKNLEIAANSRIEFSGASIDSDDISISSKGVLIFEDDVSITTNNLVVWSEGKITNLYEKATGIKGGNITVRDKGRIEGNILMLADNLNIYEESYLSADKKGYMPSNGPGTGKLGSGGGYGGRGGGDEPDQDTSVYSEKGESYGDFRLPNEYGSGGGTYSGYGGYGGGLLKLEVKNILLHGTISANGGEGIKPNYGYGGGGGSGGSVVIKTENISGTGEITANGGSQEFSCTGGGGRIAIYYKVKDSFLGKLKSLGGTKLSSGNPLFLGESGTVYLQQLEATEGELKFGEV
ncbi:MAG: lamin tail domain-containing protein [Candidatus Paceibacterota bacterium]|jgi:hypothetical protein